MDCKTCFRCKQSKPATRDEFSPLRKSKDGLHSWCKACFASWRREDRAKEPDRYRRIEKTRREKHGDKRRAVQRSRRSKAPDAVVERERERLRAHRDLYNANRRHRYEASPELRAQRAAINKQWLVENAEAVKQRRRAAWARKTPVEKFRTFFGAAISHSLKGSTKGDKSWTKILGYNLPSLRAHIERQFTKGMSWDNYGEWHIDHIIPVASFRYSGASDDAFKACWALTNLRPLWAGDNIRKRDKRLFLI